MELKSDLHLHTCEGEAFIAYDARHLIVRAARDGYRVLSITNHDLVTFSEDLKAFAEKRGILLVPGAEVTVEGKHVLVHNLDVLPERIRTFAELRRLRRPEWLVTAAHPFFPGGSCLRARLVEEVDLFDAVEFSHFYSPTLDFNRRAVAFARTVGLPLLGTSDCHLARQFGTTFSVIEAEATIEGIVSAIRAGRVRVVTRPLTLQQCGGLFAEMVARGNLQRLRTLGSGLGLRWRRPQRPPPMGATVRE